MRWLAAVCLCLLAFQPAAAQPSHRLGLVDQLNLPPIDGLGEDAVRFSTWPALPQGAFVFEARPSTDGDQALIDMWLFDRDGTRAENFRQVGSISSWMEIENYRTLTRKIDVELTRGAPNRTGQMPCLDGNSYLTERRKGGRTITLEGFCGEGHPNPRIAKIVMAAMQAKLCHFDGSACKRIDKKP